jgi:hypothetical protein
MSGLSVILSSSGFKDWVVWGGQNKMTGGQIWRLIGDQIVSP